MPEQRNTPGKPSFASAGSDSLGLRRRLVNAERSESWATRFGRDLEEYLPRISMGMLATTSSVQGPTASSLTSKSSLYSPAKSPAYNSTPRRNIDTTVQNLIICYVS